MGDSDVEMDNGEDPGPSSPLLKPKPATESPKSPKSEVSKAKVLPKDPVRRYLRR